MNLLNEAFLHAVLNTVAFGAVGVAFFGIAFAIMVKVSPFSIRKEIEEDQNVALSVLMGSVIIGIAIIVASAVH